MVKEAALYRTAEKVSAYIQRYVTLAGTDKQGEVLELFDKIQQLFPHWVIMTCPVMHPGIHYVSPNCETLFGYNSQYMLQNCSMEKYFSHIHGDDQEDLFHCFGYVQDLLESTIPDQHNLYRHIYHYRFRTAYGQYIYLHDEKAAIHLSGSGNLYYNLFRDVTAEKKFSGVRVELYKQEQGLVKIADYKPSQLHALTKREGELVALIKQGLSTKEIAWYLKISHNTVRNIKSRLFEKYNVNNTIELLNMTA